jgi:hypothetical protein
MAANNPYMTKGDIVIVLPKLHQSEDVDVKLIKEILNARGSLVRNGFQPNI